MGAKFPRSESYSWQGFHSRGFRRNCDNFHCCCLNQTQMALQHSSNQQLSLNHWTPSFLGIISNMRYRGIDRRFVNLAISWCREMDDIVHERMCHVYVACRHRPQQLHERTYGVNTHACLLFNKQCRTAVIISRTVILWNRWPVGDRVPTCRPTQANNIRPITWASVPCHNGRNKRQLVLFVLCPLNSAHCATVHFHWRFKVRMYKISDKSDTFSLNYSNLFRGPLFSGHSVYSNAH